MDPMNFYDSIGSRNEGFHKLKRWARNKHGQNRDWANKIPTQIYHSTGLTSKTNHTVNGEVVSSCNPTVEFVLNVPESNKI